jgi:hypothetical protein
MFYVAVISQVVPHTMPIMSGTPMFAGVDTAVAALYMVALAAAAGWALRWLRQARVRRAMEGTTGLCMVGLGATIALDHSLQRNCCRVARASAEAPHASAPRTCAKRFRGSLPPSVAQARSAVSRQIVWRGNLLGEPAILRA